MLNYVVQYCNKLGKAQLQNLIDKAGIIGFKYEKLDSLSRFNLFSVLRKKNDEVNLHSRFVCELLDPIGSHEQGSDFARLFFRELEIEDFDLNGLVVKREYKNIDVFISNGSQAIIIENKIGAGDQEEQLQRYYLEIEAEGYSYIKLFYLTLDGSEPSDRSIGNLSDRKDVRVELLSYDKEIRGWIDRCIEIVARRPTLRESLIQYQNLIAELTGNSMNEEQKQEMLELFSKDENAIAAKLIHDNWRHYRWHTEWDFWCDLERKIKQDYTVLPEGKFTEGKIDVMINGSRNKNPWYGLMFEIAKKAEYRICLFIERGDEDVYYGLIAYIEGKRVLLKEHEAIRAYASQLTPIFDWSETEQWLGGSYIEPRINFETFSSKDTLALGRPEFRKELVNRNWQSIKKLVADSIRTLETASASLD